MKVAADMSPLVCYVVIRSPIGIVSYRHNHLA